MSSELLLITGDFNIHVDDPRYTDCVCFLGLLESMGLQQHVDVPTHKSDHILDLIITRCANSLLSTNPIADCLFSDHFTVISDLIIKKPSLTITQILYRKTKSIDIESFKNDLQKAALCQHSPENLNELVTLYNTTLSNPLYAHAPIITKNIKLRPFVLWHSVEIRKAQRKWRHIRCDHDLLTLKLKKNYATKLMNKSHCEFYKSFIGENSSDQRKQFAATKTLLNHTHEVPYPQFKDKLTFANEMGGYFIEKIDNIQAKLDNMASGLSSLPPSSNSCLHPCSIMDRFPQLPENDVRKLIESSAKKSCKLDPMPTPLVVNCIDSRLPVITKIINLSLSTGYFSD